jgi:cytochrome c peroxidase
LPPIRDRDRLSLLGVADTAPLAWNGGMADLETQIRASVGSTMRGTTLADSQIEDLAAFVRSLRPVNAEARGDGDDDAGLFDRRLARGREIFVGQKCDRCHAPPQYTSPGAYDVELTDENGQHHFNPPSLRGVADRDRLFHDNRADGLTDVFRRYQHQLQTELDDEELRSLIVFLRSL